MVIAVILPFWKEPDFEVGFESWESLLKFNRALWTGQMARQRGFSGVVLSAMLATGTVPTRIDGSLPVSSGGLLVPPWQY